MKLLIATLLLAAVVISECGHTFLGTNVMRQQMFHTQVKFKANIMTKRIETVNYTMPYASRNGQTIQGILAYDLTNSGASANVTKGGLGYSYVTLRLKSDRGKPLKYDIYVYA